MPWHFDRSMEFSWAGRAQHRQGTRADEGGQRSRAANARVADRVYVTHAGDEAALRFPAPFFENEFEPTRLEQNLRRVDPNFLQFLDRKITSPRLQVRGRVAQNVDQLQTVPVTFAQLSHFHLRQVRKIPDVPKAKPRPKFAHTSGDEIGVFVKL